MLINDIEQASLTEEIRKSGEGRLWLAVILSGYNPYLLGLNYYISGPRRRWRILANRYFSGGRHPTELAKKLGHQRIMAEIDEADKFFKSKAFTMLCEVLGYDEDYFRTRRRKIVRLLVQAMQGRLNYGNIPLWGMVAAELPNYKTLLPYMRTKDA